MDNIQGVLPPIVLDIVPLECHRKNDSTRILDTNAEGFEDFDLWVVFVCSGAVIVYQYTIAFLSALRGVLTALSYSTHQYHLVD